ncbi:hypothetical protein [Ruegeria meonggei]|uniref:DUF306 domain-containing protein n=1 Tax=Ruegeria meonggei TaxID=1446476 RepID=A0A1X6ZY46_9RHOB|nr:hypothetical protein [Ruegeria meonggei]SLN64970.1 hypothetical protein RUM8411_03224 [Ruegeria meonggei]
MKHRVLAAISLGVFTLAGSAWADEDDWSGLYKGLDILDGSIDYLSISRTDAETYELRIIPSVISLCQTGRGWIVADGVLNDEGNMLRQNGRVFCEGEQPNDVPDRVLSREKETGIIRYGATDDKRPLVYHKVSSD